MSETASTFAGTRRPPPFEGYVSETERELEAWKTRAAELGDQTGILQARVSELEAQLAESREANQKHVSSLVAQIDRTGAARDAAVKREQETREQFAELKERLHRSELELARLEGYLDRVSEDDAAREEPRVFQEPRVVPRRPPPMRREEGCGCGSVTAAGDNSRDFGMSSRRPRHWTGY